jgi:hypothetical protein
MRNYYTPTTSLQAGRDAIEANEKLIGFIHASMEVSRDSAKYKREATHEIKTHSERFGKLGDVHDSFRGLSHTNPEILQALYQYRKGDKKSPN